MMKDLIEKYFAGNTTLEEEAELQAYFRRRDISPELRAHAPLFWAQEECRKLRVSADFDQRLRAKMDRAERPLRRPLRTSWLLRAAAIGVLLVGAFFFWKNWQTEPPQQAEATPINWSKYEITDEDAALEETTKALRLLSDKLNKGKRKTLHEVGKTEKVGKYIE